MNKFEQLGINGKLAKRLEKFGIKNPTSIQEKSIGLIINKKDLIGEAPTGTGKTFAYLLPIIDSITESKQGIQSLILCPTRELALQISEEVQKININNLNIMTIYGGREYSKQISDTKGNIDIIVATPGRLIDFINQGLIKLNSLKHLVLDEADQMLLMGFQNDVETIVNASNKKRQTLCFSATLNKEVKKLAYKITKEASLVQVENNLSNKIKKYLVETSDREKIDALCTVLNDTRPFMGIIFCRTKARVDKLEQRLEERNYNVQKLHSDIVQVKREKILKSFRDAEIQFLVATDVASRGLDITGVTHIFNYDTPEQAESYIHRVGRTARGDELGETYLFATEKDKKIIEEIETLLGEKFERKNFVPEKDINNIHENFSKKYNKKINTRTKEKREVKKK